MAKSNLIISQRDPKTIVYDRETRDYRGEINGELIAFYRTYHEADCALDSYMYEQHRNQQAAS